MVGLIVSNISFISVPIINITFAVTSCSHNQCIENLKKLAILGVRSQGPKFNQIKIVTELDTLLFCPMIQLFKMSL